MRSARAVPALLVATLVTAAVSSPAAAQAADSAAAYRAATVWLRLVDNGEFGASIDSAAPLFRQIVGSADHWKQFAGQARSRYPVSSDREVVSWEPAFTPEGAPDGHYARMTFQSKTAPHSRESVILVLTASGWRVAMYGVSAGAQARAATIAGTTPAATASL